MVKFAHVVGFKHKSSSLVNNRSSYCCIDSSNSNFVYVNRQDTMQQCWINPWGAGAYANMKWGALLSSPPFPFPPLSFHPLPPLRSRPPQIQLGRLGEWSSQRKSNLVHFSLKIWHLVAPILLIFLRINWPQCMHFFKLHKKTFSLRIFSAHNAKSNTLMLSTKMTSYHKLYPSLNVKFRRCSSIGHPILWPWIRGPLL